MAYKYSRGVFTASGSVSAEEGLSSSTTLTVNGVATLKSQTVVQGDLQVSGTQFQVLSSSGATIFQVDSGGARAKGVSFQVQDGGGNPFVSLDNAGNISGSNQLQVGNNATIGGILTVNNATNLNSQFNANGPVNLGNGDADLIVVSGSTSGDFFIIKSDSDIARVSKTNGLQVVQGNISSSNGFQGGGSSTLNNLTLNGDLTVKGTTTTVNSTTLEISDANIVIASGSTTSLAANNAGITVGSTGYQIKFVSGSAGALSDSWQFSGSGGFTDIRAGIVTATSFIGSIALSITEQPDGSATLAKGVNYMTGTLSTPRTWTLPASPVIGDSVRVKAPSNCGNGVGQYILTVSASGAHLIDGEGTAPLESPYAAIECVYVANNKWSIF